MQMLHGLIFLLYSSSSYKAKTLREDAHSCISKMSLDDCNWRGKKAVPDKAPKRESVRKQTFLKKMKKLLDLELTPSSKMTLNIGAAEHLGNNRSADITVERRKCT
jgi:hypothetical protein